MQKSKTISINGYVIPEPVSESLEIGTVCWIPVLGERVLAVKLFWCADSYDTALLKNGVVHLTREAAILHGKALLSFTKQD